MNKMIGMLVLAILTVLGVVGCGDNEPKRANSDGTTMPADQCPALGSGSSAEGAKCADRVVHCGYWVPVGSNAAYENCTGGNEPPASTCNAGQACSTPGSTCNGAAGALTCYCGFWATPYMMQSVSCESSNPNPGTGGSGGSSSGTGGDSGTGGSEGSYGSPATGYDVIHLSILASAQHIYCEGAATEPSYGDDVNVKFLEYWHSFGCDSYDGSYECDVYVPNDAALRYQCYLESPDPQPGDQVRYTCAKPTQLMSGEASTATLNGTPVSPQLAANLAPEPSPQSSFNCVLVASGVPHS